MANAHLIEIQSLNQAYRDHTSYLTLSYRWGLDSEHIYKTTLGTLQSRKERIYWTELPQAFQDAFRVACRIHMPFLWIDALCILQDSAADWERESAKMGGIFATGFATIAADVGDSVNEGFLDITPTEAEEDLPNLAKFTSTLESGQQSTLVFWNASSAGVGFAHTPPWIERSPLSRRAWCMQERMLSPRTLHFTKKGLMWECRELYLGLQMISTVNEASLRLTFAGFLRSVEKGTEGGLPPIERLASPEQLATMTEESLNLLTEALATGATRFPRYGRAQDRKLGEQSDFVAWWNRNVVTDYSSRTLTFDSDRLPAISGAARLFGEYVQSPYLAGIWLAELEEGLEWGRGGPACKNEKLASHPQFSWTSHPGPVEYPYIAHVRGYGKAFDIISHSVTLAGNNDYGRVTTAELVLRSHIRPAYFDSDRINETRRPYKIKRSLLDAADGVKIGEADLDLDYSMEELSMGVYCFLLYRHSLGHPRFLLLLKKVMTPLTNTFASELGLFKGNMHLGYWTAKFELFLSQVVETTLSGWMSYGSVYCARFPI